MMGGVTRESAARPVAMRLISREVQTGSKCRTRYTNAIDCTVDGMALNVSP